MLRQLAASVCQRVFPGRAQPVQNGDSEPVDSEDDPMPPQARGAGGRGGPRRAGGGATTGAGDAAPASPAVDLARLPRGSRETAMLLRTNGYGVLNEEKLRRQAAPAGARSTQPAPAQQQQQQQQQAQEGQRRQARSAPKVQDEGEEERQQPQRRRQVRLVEPAKVAQQQEQQPSGRRPADRKRRRTTGSDPSSSEEEERAVAARTARSQQAPPPAPPQQQAQGGGMKRVRSAWKMRPLLIDEKLAVFVEGRDAALLHYDSGDFYQWLKDCEAGLADPADGFPYPLVVQDKDLRTLLEIKPPGQEPGGDLRLAAVAQAAAAAAAGGADTSGIIVPTVRLLRPEDQPDQLVREHNPPVVRRLTGEGPDDMGLEPDVAGTSAAARAASAAWASAERAVALDPPYIRYVQPTPDDLDLAVEYDLDEEDEEWLERYNTEAKRAKSRKARRTLGEEWMEHLIDRMEKEYTAELQRHPSQWVVQVAEPGGSDQPAAVSLPAIEDVFPLQMCLQARGINHYQNVIEAVYNYWKDKHQRAGRPLIQRLWYEPPWDRRKAARMASAAGEDGAEGEEGPFHGQDSPVALAGIRKRRMDPEEVKSRFQEIRRDLESARTLADQVRKREKLKRRELQLYKEEWAARMQAIQDGAERVVVQQGHVVDAPAQLSAVWRLQAAGLGAWGDADQSGETEEEPLMAGGPQDAAAQAEERAVRLALRRMTRDVSAAAPPRAQQQQQQQARRPVGRPRAAAAAPSQRKERAHRSGASGTVLKQAGNVRGPPPAPGVRREPVCVWCNSTEFLMLGCATCPRCFCFKCFQRRPGLGINNWSRAVKDSRYRCVMCRGVEAEDAPSANTADELPAPDAADATSPRHAQPRQQQHAQPLTAARVESERLAEQLGVEVPRGLGGAALRSWLVRMRREMEMLGEGEEGPAAAAMEEDGEEAQHEAQQQQQQQHKPSRARPSHRAARGAAGGHRRQAVGSASSSEGEYGEDEDEQQRWPKQRKLGGAALASHLRRLEQRRQDRDRARHEPEDASDAEHPSSDGEDAWPHPHIPPPPRKLGGAALRSYIKRQEALLEEAVDGGERSDAGASSGEEGWPHPHIPPPSRKLGGAALRSYVKRQEELLAAAEEEEEEASEGSEEGWLHPHIPPPTRKLGGAALRSYIKRQEALLEGGGDGKHHHHHHQPQRSGSSSGTAEEFGASSEEVDGVGSDASSDEGLSHLKENRAPPAKRARKALGGAALAAQLRKAAAAEAVTSHVERRGGAGHGLGRRPRR